MKLKWKKLAFEAAYLVNRSLMPSHIAIRLLCNTIALRRARFVLCMDEGGFGHTLTIPDMARRVLGENTVCVFRYDPRRHNRYTRHLWPDVVCIFIPIQPVFRWSRCFAPGDIPRFNRIVNKVVKFVFGKSAIFHKSDYSPWVKRGVYDWMADKCVVAMSELVQHKNVPNTYLAYYFRAVQSIPAPDLVVPKGLKNSFSRIARRLNGGTDPSLMSLYLRRKGDKNDVTNYIRNSGDLEGYGQLAHHLASEHGYRVLLVGDVRVADFPVRFQSALWDATTFSLDPRIFSLLAVFASERFIGNDGGGWWLPALMKKPALMVDVYPYGDVMLNSLVLYKRLVDPQGTEISVTDCLENQLWVHEFPEGYVVRTNTTDELLAASAEFLAVPLLDWFNYCQPQAIFRRSCWALQARARLVACQE